MTSSSVIVRDLLIAFGLDRALRIVRMHYNTRQFVMGVLGVAYMQANFANFDHTHSNVVNFLHGLSTARVRHIYRLLIGLYFLSHLCFEPHPFLLRTQRRNLTCLTVSSFFMSLRPHTARKHAFPSRTQRTYAVAHAFS